MVDSAPRPTYSDAELTLLEESVPSVHQALVSGSYDDLGGAARAEVVIASLLAHWGNASDGMPSVELARRHSLLPEVDREFAERVFVRLCTVLLQCHIGVETAEQRHIEFREMLASKIDFSYLSDDEISLVAQYDATCKHAVATSRESSLDAVIAFLDAVGSPSESSAPDVVIDAGEYSGLSLSTLNTNSADEVASIVIDQSDLAKGAGLAKTLLAQLGGSQQTPFSPCLALMERLVAVQDDVRREVSWAMVTVAERMKDVVGRSESGTGST